MGEFFASLPPRTRFLLILAISLALGAYTSSKLYGMAQIRGWVPGATTRVVEITAKHVSGGRRGDAYWIAWMGDVTQPGDHRMNLEFEQWDALEVGDPVEVVYSSVSSRPSMRGGIYTSNGNVLFDGLLLCAELGTAITMLVKLYRLRRQPAPGQPA